MMKKIINLTNPAVDISIRSVGLRIPANGFYIINPIEYTLWLDEDAITEVSNHVTEGSLILNDGNQNLSIQESLRYLKTLSRVDVSLRDSDVVRGFSKIDFNGNVNVVEDDGVAVVTIGENGNSFTVSCNAIGTVSDKWASVEHPSATSDEVPFVMPGACRITSIAYSNANNSSEIDIRIHKNGSLAYTWEIRNKRVAYNNSSDGLVTAAAGDRISVFFKSVSGTSPKDPLVVLFIAPDSIADGTGGIENGV